MSLIPDALWPYVLWIVIFCFYLAEHLKFAAPETVLISSRAPGRLSLDFPRVPFLLGARQLLILPPIPAWAVVVRGRLAPTDRVSERDRAVEARRIDRIRRRTAHFALAEPYVFVFYFLVLPAVTGVRGLVFALLVFAPVQIAILIYFWIGLAGYRSVPGDKPACRICLALEMIIVPGMIPALSKRLAFAHAAPHDAAMLVWPSLSEGQRAAVLDRLTFRVGDMRENSEITEADAASYLAAVQA